MPNPPSIPSHDNVFGYEEVGPDGSKKKLVRQTNTEKIYAGDQKDSVGPGNYEVAFIPK